MLYHISKNKQACEPPESRWAPPPMDTRNPKRVIGALPVSWVGIRYLMEGKIGRWRRAWGHRVGVIHRNSHLLDERKQRKLLLNVYLL
ncbi:hypothetical protein EVAR_74876_1 [Eumeta japonica]|uniref:Uncharacterized protein n=1 Tax=Eumeta variegata TaxID=151549 RepID=A0A4C1SSH2_EUMVA|nr:hypothetical protein EVAR_74876_1 [Eumeta japonica]